MQSPSNPPGPPRNHMHHPMERRIVQRHIRGSPQRRPIASSSCIDVHARMHPYCRRPSKPPDSAGRQQHTYGLPFTALLTLIASVPARALASTAHTRLQPDTKASPNEDMPKSRRLLSSRPRPQKNSAALARRACFGSTRPPLPLAPALSGAPLVTAAAAEPLGGQVLACCATEPFFRMPP